MKYDVAVEKFGADKLTDKNGKPLNGAGLNARIDKLTAEAAKVQEQKAQDATAFDDAPGSKSNPLPTIDKVSGGTSTPATPASAGASAFVKARFAVEKNVPMPERKRGGAGNRESKYPFASLDEVGDSFFVPSTADMPKPWKTLASLGSRKSKELPPMNFSAVHILANPATGQVEGCRVFRVADLTAPKAPRPRKPKPAQE